MSGNYFRTDSEAWKIFDKVTLLLGNYYHMNRVKVGKFLMRSFYDIKIIFLGKPNDDWDISGWETV